MTFLRIDVFAEERIDSCCTFLKQAQNCTKSPRLPVLSGVLFDA